MRETMLLLGLHLGERARIAFWDKEYVPPKPVRTARGSGQPAWHATDGDENLDLDSTFTSQA